ncbi:MAG TPA: hypothetical protein VFV10_05560 [Gammaproteobacteria bacterium]|nr:hypothetical protein [Gammaproteobacteria bacterium]
MSGQRTAPRSGDASGCVAALLTSGPLARSAGAALLAAALLAAAPAPALAQVSDEARVRAFAALPNWTGIWIAADGVMNDLGLNGRGPTGVTDFAKLLLVRGVPYNAETEAKIAARANSNDRATAKECGFPFPFVMESPWPFEFLITPEETAMIVAGREIRHIYTDGRAHPKAEDLWPTPWGDSVGRWDGHTLVVDTIAVQPGTLPPVVTEQAHFTERIRMTSPDRIEDEITIDDPAALTRPFTVTIPYERVPGLDRLVHGDCRENDRNPVVDGKITITPP